MFQSLAMSFYLLLKAVEKMMFMSYKDMLERLISAEVMSLQIFPHTNYGIVCGAGLLSNAFLGQTHIGPSATYKGKKVHYFTVKGSALREGRRPYVPIVPSLCNIVKKCWYGTTVTRTSGPSTRAPWLTQVNFVCYNNGVLSTPPINVGDFSFGPQVMQYLDFVLPYGLLFGPPAIWSVSLILGQFSSVTNNMSYRDFALAMTPAALTQYDRVE